MAQYQECHFLAGNKGQPQTWDKTSYDFALHRHNIKNAKPTIDITPPKTYRHLSFKMEKQKNDREKKIQQENNVLLEKIAYIKKTTGAVDNQNVYEKKSLNMQKRRTELLRISQENQLMLQRLNQCSSNFSVKSWHHDWIKTLSLMDKIAKYPRRTHTKGPKKDLWRNLDEEKAEESHQRKKHKELDEGSLEKTN